MCIEAVMKGGPGGDNLEEVSALPPFIVTHHLNLFLVKYSQALKSFGDQTESKLMELQVKVNRIENALLLIEKKLEPFESDMKIATTKQEHAVQVEASGKSKFEESETEIETEQNEREATKLTVKNEPKFEKYFKMLKMGVPMEAVKLKMTREQPNLDAYLLETPDADYFKQ